MLRAILILAVLLTATCASAIEKITVYRLEAGYYTVVNGKIFEWVDQILEAHRCGDDFFQYGEE